MRKIGAIILFLALAGVGGLKATPVPPEKKEETVIEKATFAAGCFWGIEYSFSQLPGVLSTRVGYTGGHSENPTYREVCTDTTGHAEAVDLEFNPKEISYEALLEHFWKIHNPTTLNRQGPDVGSQYRSAIFYYSEAQREAAQSSLEAHQKTLDRSVVTEITAASNFFPAEEYHQKYVEKGGHCHIPGF